jgi:hypothetical protein
MDTTAIPGSAGREREQANSSWLQSVFEPLWRVFHVTRFGVIDGVTLDLRHPLIDPWRWRINTLWIDSEEGWSQGPKIWFPWFGPFDEVGLYATAVKRDDDVRRWASGPSDRVEEILRDLLPSAQASPGDVIEIDQVRVSIIGDEFDHEHDREVREVHLRLVHPDGVAHRLDEPIRFLGATAFVADPVWDGVSVDKVTARICDDLTLPSLEAFDLITDEVTTAELAFAEAKWLTRDLQVWLALLPEPWETVDRELSRAHLVALMDRAVSLGYHWAQAEAEKRFRPLALAGLASARGAELAGYRSGEARRRKAQETWHPHALELARHSRDQNAQGSQDAVVADIQAGWKLEVPTCPGTKTLKVFVSGKERSGALPRRQVG